MHILARDGEWGWIHRFVTGIDHDAVFVEARIHYRKPDNTVEVKVCDVVDAAAGEYGYTVEVDFFTPGKWEAQLELDLGAAGIRKLRNSVVFLIGESGES